MPNALDYGHTFCVRALRPCPTRTRRYAASAPSPAPLADVAAAAGMARLRLFLTDGAGPLFHPTSEYLMADVLQRIEEDLDPDQGARR